MFKHIQPAPLPKYSNNRTYDPLVDLVSFTATHKTRQVRRLYSFRRTLAVHCGPNGKPLHREQLRHLWNAIRTAEGYTPDFPTWTQQCTGVWYLDCINLEALRWIDQLILHCRADCDQFACQSRTMRTQDFKTKLEVDWGQHGGKFTAFLLRKPAFAAANHMTTTVSYTCTRLRATSKMEPRIRVADSKLAVGEILIIQGERCRIMQKPFGEV